MELRRLLYVAVTFVFMASSQLSLGQIPVPPAVRQFYGGMEQMLACNTTAEISELEMSMNKCFFGYENSGMNLPNDFRHIELDAGTPSHDNEMLTSNNYINKLSKYVYADRSLKPTVKISSFSKKTGTLPTFDKKMSAEDAYVETIVRKNVSYVTSSGLVDKEFIDTVYTHVIQNRISVIVNGMGTDKGDNNLELLKVRAAQAYQDKRYGDAYKIFQRIIELDRHDSEPLYRLALMTYYGKGCKSDKRKGISLMEESSYRHGLYSTKADNVLRNWKYKNVL